MSVMHPRHSAPQASGAAEPVERLRTSYRKYWKRAIADVSLVRASSWGLFPLILLGLGASWNPAKKNQDLGTSRQRGQK